MGTPSSRIKVFDIIKLFTIYLVIWGHVILHLQNYEFDVWDNPLYRWIYSFHMPLFMMISGYFGVSVISSFKEYFIKKFRQLILPSLTFGLVFILSWHFVNNRGGVLTYFFCYWFLKSAFICAILYFIANMFSNKTMGYIITIVLSLFCYSFLVNYMYLPFLCGVALANKKDLLKLHALKILLISGIIFFIMYMNWDSTMAKEPVLKLYQYFSDGMLKELDFPIFCFVYKVILGLSGSLFFTTLFIVIGRVLPENSIGNQLASWGTLTLGIYLWQAILLEHLMMKTINLADIEMYMFNHIVSPLISIVVMLICIYFTQLLKLNKWTNRIFLGAK